VDWAGYQGAFQRPMLPDMLTFTVQAEPNTADAALGTREDNASFIRVLSL